MCCLQRKAVSCEHSVERTHDEHVIYNARLFYASTLWDVRTTSVLFTTQGCFSCWCAVHMTGLGAPPSSAGCSVWLLLCCMCPQICHWTYLPETRASLTPSTQPPASVKSPVLSSSCSPPPPVSEIFLSVLGMGPPRLDVL